MVSEEKIMTEVDSKSNYICVINDLGGLSKYFIDVSVADHEVALESGTGTEKHC